MSAFRHDGYSESSVLYLRTALVGIFVPLHSGDNSSGPRSSSNPLWHLGQEPFLVGRAFSNTLVLALSISVHWVL